MSASDAATDRFDAATRTGWEAAMLEIEHQAEHWDTPDHGETGHLIASALRAAVEIARAGGLRCEHRSRKRMGRRSRSFLLPEMGPRSDGAAAAEAEPSV